MEISNKNLEFVYLHKREYVEAKMYPYFTMLGQSLGSLILGMIFRIILLTLNFNKCVLSLILSIFYRKVHGLKTLEMYPPV